jgi:holo-[acyl-carrier protein] synthase
MEIVGVGSGIVECLRIGAMIERHGELFLQRAYTEREIRYCQSRRRATEQFAAHWAAKEAVLKALATGSIDGVSWFDVEIRVGPRDRPTVLVGGPAKDVIRRLKVADVLVSMAHCRTYATAHATAIARPGREPGA